MSRGGGVVSSTILFGGSTCYTAAAERERRAAVSIQRVTFQLLYWAPAGFFDPKKNRQKRSGDHILLRNGLKRVLASGGLHPPDTKIKSWIT